MNNITINNGRLSFRWTTGLGTVFELSVLVTGEAGLFVQVAEGSNGDPDDPGKWEHITDKVFAHTACGKGVIIADSVGLAIMLNTIHASIASGFMSTYKPGGAS